MPPLPLAGNREGIHLTVSGSGRRLGCRDAPPPAHLMATAVLDEGRGRPPISSRLPLYSHRPNLSPPPVTLPRVLSKTG